MLPRGKRAITKRYNLVDKSRRSLNYETRLMKYARRGFAVLVANFDQSRVDGNLYSQLACEVTGLAKLLLFDNQLNAPIDRSIRTVRQRGDHRSDSINAQRRLEYRQRTETEASESSSDYTEFFIPWGPTWFNWQIVALLRAKQTLLRSNASKFSKPVDVDFFTEGLDASIATDRLRWITDEPGRQLLSGSFHRVDDAHWETDVVRFEEQERDFVRFLREIWEEEGRAVAPGLAVTARVLF